MSIILLEKGLLLEDDMLRFTYRSELNSMRGFLSPMNAVSRFGCEQCKFNIYVACMQVLNVGQNHIAGKLELSGLPSLGALIANDNAISGLKGALSLPLPCPVLSLRCHIQASAAIRPSVLK